MLSRSLHIKRMSEWMQTEAQQAFVPENVPTNRELGTKRRQLTMTSPVQICVTRHHRRDHQGPSRQCGAVASTV